MQCMRGTKQSETATTKEIRQGDYLLFSGFDAVQMQVQEEQTKTVKPGGERRRKRVKKEEKKSNKSRSYPGKTD